MGVLDDAIREHLDLKRRRGASDDEIARAEAEALGPPRRTAEPLDDDERGRDDDLGHDDEPRADSQATRIIEPMDDVAPPPDRPEPTRAVHDIDEDPLAPPAPVERPHADDEPVDDEPVDDAPVDDAPVDDAPVEPPPIDPGPRLDEPIRWPRDDSPRGRGA